MLKKFVGSKAFYKTTLAIILPIIIQNTITTFVNFLDNIMVGQLGTEQMSGVSIVNQFFFFFNLCIFGCTAGAGIFLAQFFGKNDNLGVKQCFRIKLIGVLLINALVVTLILTFQDKLINYFLHQGSIEGDLQLTFECAKEYLSVIVYMTPAFSIMFAYSSTLRETGKTSVPMNAGFVAVFVNFILNYALIFGHFGLPAMGVKGAALATVISRFVECITLIVFTHSKRSNLPWSKGIYKSFKISSKVLKPVVIKGLPLLINEALWALSMTLLLQCYSQRGLDAVAANNISNTLDNLFSIVFMSIGSSISIVVGQLLGAGKLEEANDANNKIIALSVFSTLIMGSLLASLSGVIPLLYNTYDSVRKIATNNLLVIAMFMPIHALVHASYFTIRTGGKTFITFLFDSAFGMLISVPFAYLLATYTDLGVTEMFALVNSLNLIKAVWGVILLKKGIWLNVIVKENK